MNERAFSRKCRACRQRAVAITVVPYTIQVDHDGRKYMVRIQKLSTPQCKACGAISIDAVAEKEIDAAFRREAGLLTPEEIRQKREHLKLTQQELADFWGWLHRPCRAGKMAYRCSSALSIGTCALFLMCPNCAGIYNVVLFITLA